MKRDNERQVWPGDEWRLQNRFYGDWPRHYRLIENSGLTEEEFITRHAEQAYSHLEKSISPELPVPEKPESASTMRLCVMLAVEYGFYPAIVRDSKLTFEDVLWLRGLDSGDFAAKYESEAKQYLRNHSVPHGREDRQLTVRTAVEHGYAPIRQQFFQYTRMSPYFRELSRSTMPQAEFDRLNLQGAYPFLTDRGLVRGKLPDNERLSFICVKFAVEQGYEPKAEPRGYSIEELAWVSGMSLGRLTDLHAGRAAQYLGQTKPGTLLPNNGRAIIEMAVSSGFVPVETGIRLVYKPKALQG
ncbi:hypothetical protein HYY74_05795 [Candidatus Woesearchaeota archaeon]|nr:hypothetical protein [Candidatus Woesearchaeota archaeon]